MCHFPLFVHFLPWNTERSFLPHYDHNYSYYIEQNAHAPCRSTYIGNVILPKKKHLAKYLQRRKQRNRLNQRVDDVSTTLKNIYWPCSLRWTTPTRNGSSRLACWTVLSNCCVATAVRPSSSTPPSVSGLSPGNVRRTSDKPTAAKLVKRNLFIYFIMKIVHRVR